MSDTDSLYQTLGGLQLPLQETGATTLASLDPARDILLGLFAAALSAELTPRWADVVASGTLSFTTPVKTQVPHELDEATIQQLKISFPALAVYRETENQEVTEHSVWQTKLKSHWGVDYILGPLGIGDRRKLGDALTAAAKIVLMTVERGGHRAYLTNDDGFPVNVLSERDYCNFITTQVAHFTAGKASFSDEGESYHAMSLRLTTEEWTEPTASESRDYEGSNLSMSTGNYEGLVPEIVTAKTNVG
jgi:hypothetical protein